MYSHIYDTDSLRRCHNNLTRDTPLYISFSCTALCVRAPVHVSERVREREKEK